METITKCYFCAKESVGIFEMGGLVVGLCADHYLEKGEDLTPWERTLKEFKKTNS